MGNHLLSELDQSALVRSYNPLQQEITLRSILGSLFPMENFDHYSKKELHFFINKVILRDYRGEQYYKYQLAKKYLRHKVIAGFEVNVGSTRSDFLLINGATHNFEIKSRLDDLKRLNTQIESYITVFEYNYVVADESHFNKICEIIPDSVGIWTFVGNRKKVIRSAKLNKSIDQIAQLNLLTAKELKKEFGTNDIILIELRHSKEEINQSFKRILKMRYGERWRFICANWESILPIDLQFFFKKNIEPSLIY